MKSFERGGVSHHNATPKRRIGYADHLNFKGNGHPNLSSGGTDLEAKKQIF